MNKPFFDEANFVPVPRVPEWPVFQPESLPSDWKKIAEITDHSRSNAYIWNLYSTGRMLIFYRHKDGFNRFNGEPMRYINQYEYPIEAAGWFVDNLPRFFKKPGEPGALPPEEFSLSEECCGERLGISRLVNSVARDVPGYSLKNQSRCDHPDMDLCQSFDMSDEFLFNGGMLDLFKDIAARYKAGTL